jgi:predicted esterase
VVVLADQPYSTAASRHWQDIAGRLWDGKYLVALMTLPKDDSKSGPRDAAASTVAEVVRDARSRTPIDPKRVYLLGEGASGMEAYACSLEPNTPFHGFMILSSAFRSAQLPALSASKSRRYCLVHPRTSKAAPYVMAQAAESLLKQKGALVKLLPFEGAPSESGAGAGLDTALRQGMLWLNEGK